MDRGNTEPLTADQLAEKRRIFDEQLAEIREKAKEHQQSVISEAVIRIAAQGD